MEEYWPKSVTSFAVNRYITDSVFELNNDLLILALFSLEKLLSGDNLIIGAVKLTIFASLRKTVEVKFTGKFFSDRRSFFRIHKKERRYFLHGYFDLALQNLRAQNNCKM